MAFIKNLFTPWRQNIALHATLTTKQIVRIDNNSRDLVQLNTAASPLATSADNLATLKLKCPGKTSDGIEVFVEIELIGPPHQLQQFQFAEGKHVGLVLRAID